MLRLRLSHLAILAAGCAGLLAPGVQADSDAQPGTTIRDPYYGEVLYQFYQQKDFEALTHLLAARQAGRVTHHADEAELLLGGLYLSYGQYREADDIFARLLNESADPLVRDRAWLYVGKAHYERSQYREADAAFARVGDALPQYLQDEMRMLRAQSLMAQQKFAAAAELLDGWEGAGSWHAYATYNLGVALVRMQKIDEGAQRLNTVGQMQTDDPEVLALRDKANLALGYAYLQAGDAEHAKPVLERVRLNGPFSNKALLGVGWADATLEDYKAALTPWLELRDRDLLDSAVQESLLAVPYAFSQLGAAGSAAEYYQAAMSHFDDELANLDAALERTQSGALVPLLLTGDNDAVGRWHWSLETLPDTDDARYLYHLIANHRFQDGLRGYRDLIALRGYIADWQQKLGVYEDMIDTRRLAFAQRLPAADERFAQAGLESLTERRDQLAARLARVERERDVVGLATTDEARLWQDIAALRENPAFSEADQQGARDKYRLLRGTLLWDLDADYRYRRWQADRDLAALDEELATAREREAAYRAARDQMPLVLDEYANRIAALTPRLDAMQARITAALSDQEDSLTRVVAEELDAQKSRLLSYRLQARYALATIYDQATLAEQRTGSAE